MVTNCEERLWEREEESVHTAGMGVGAIFACLKMKVKAKKRN